MGKNKSLIMGAAAALLLVGVILLGGCVPAGETNGTTDVWTFVIFLALMFGMFYFVMVRPQRKRQQEHQKLVAELKRGDRVVTAGGIHGVIESTNEDSIVIKVESGATIRLTRGSVALKQES